MWFDSGLFSPTRYYLFFHTLHIHCAAFILLSFFHRGGGGGLGKWPHVSIPSNSSSSPCYDVRGRVENQLFTSSSSENEEVSSTAENKERCP